MTDDSNADISQQLRSRSLCGKCTASKFIGWRKSGQVETDKLPKLSTALVDEKLAYIVKCDYLKQVINEPEHIVLCDAFILADSESPESP